MDVRELALPGVLEIIPRIFNDERGYFFESYNQEAFEKIGIKTVFVQDNQSFSKKGVVRGLHMQSSPFAQSKLVRVISGEILDVVVDCRNGSKTFGKYLSLILSSKTNNMLLIPEGFAHGFSALEDSIFSYKCSNVYNKESELGIHPLDFNLQIDWKVEDPVISSKDLTLTHFQKFVSPF